MIVEKVVRHFVVGVQYFYLCICFVFFIVHLNCQNVLFLQSDEGENTFLKPLVTTEFVEWSAKTFILPRQKSSDELNSTSSPLHSYSDR